jgi:hypothetical protein
MERREPTQGETKMTTSQLRNLAYDAADSQKWTEAAAFMDSAIAEYPARGGMADLDKAKMQARADSWRAS